MAVDDNQLVTRFQRGDEEAFNQLVDRHRRRVYNLVCRLANSGEADDLTQEVFLGVYRALPRFRGESSFATWIYRITVHICSRYVRRRRFETQDLMEWDVEADAAVGPEGRAELSELQQRVRAAIGELPYKLRVVIVLRDLHGLSYEEIARIAGCPVGTVRSRIHYATQKLGEKLKSYVEV